MSEIEVITFGCRLNIFESELMKGLGHEADLKNIVIVNTCAVTSEAERQARQAIRKAHRENPHKKIVVTGCAAQIRPEVFAEIEGVTHVIGNHEKMQAKTFAALSNTATSEVPDVQVNDIMAVTTNNTSQVVTSFDGKARAYVEIQNGCNHRCTFCTIPFGRGNNRSTPIAQIVHQVKLLQENGYREIVLTGVDITDFGQDLPGRPKLGDLVKRLFTNVPKLERLRLSSLDPVEMDPVLFDLIAHEPRLMPHFHLSAQAGDTMILKRMKRRHVREDIYSCADEIIKRRPAATLGADVIAGFPTETDAMFENTYNLVKDINFTFLHVFPYSPRPGTPAARMPQVDRPRIKARAAELRALGENLQSNYYKSCAGQDMCALIEEPLKARTDTYAPVILQQQATPGDVVVLKNLALDGKTLVAR